MFDYKAYFDAYCRQENFRLHLSIDMPPGYQEANGTFDVTARTVFINETLLREMPDYEKLFFLFHELRHASQYLTPEKLSTSISRSIPYTIMYDGTCYKLVDGSYHSCKLDGGEDYFVNLYLGQPYEVDANAFAYEQVKSILGDSVGLKKLYSAWMPAQPIAQESYESVYELIDEKLGFTASRNTTEKDRPERAAR